MYRPTAYYYRPGVICARKIDTDLLLTCRLVYSETSQLPASINEHTSWYYREPPDIKKRYVPVDDHPASVVRRRHLQTVHIFTQQAWLESYGFANFMGLLWTHACPTTLIITLRHSDWWWWEDEASLTLDPKQEGQASVTHHSRPSDPFPSESWGYQFRKASGLKKLQMELETVESKREELDTIVNRAEGWEFSLGDDRILRLNKSKTRRTGWTGVLLDTDFEEGRSLDIHLGNDQIDNRLEYPPAAKARKRLEATGVLFDEAGSVKGLPAHKTSTYYVVTLTWEAH
ncbi:MAG: hypothetical protein L6R40_004991 [Gallowayella cf. fulva]|nr:MAG: hypothetical protein L6R40_004991 [Xanthomendoza cf. fulva]